jgi:hypothetical protein
MVVYSFYIFDRHGKPLTSSRRPYTHPPIAECIYKRRWLPRPTSSSGKISRPPSRAKLPDGVAAPVRQALSAEDDAKLIFGTVFSLRNMVRKLGGEDDR